MLPGVSQSLLTAQGRKLHTQAINAARRADHAAAHRLSPHEQSQPKLLLSMIFLR